MKTLEWHRHEIIFEASTLGSGAVELLRSFNYKSSWNASHELRGDASKSTVIKETADFHGFIMHNFLFIP